MNNRLSHSSLTKYSDCAKAYDFHYNHRLRSKTMSAALLFGTTFDKAVEVLVKNLDDEGDLAFDKAIDVFNELWEKQEINGVVTELSNNPNITYTKTDLDLDLFDKEITEEIDRALSEKEKVGFDNLSVEDKITINKVSWYIAKFRGELMLKAVNDEVLPKLTKIHSTQEKIDLNNDSGDSVIGYADLVADYEDYHCPIVFDFKTSTRPYEADSVRSSPQLALYVHALEEKYKTRKAGFIVLSKQIQKNRTKICSICKHDGTGQRHKTCNVETVDGGRCDGDWIETINPKAKVEVIIDDIPEQLESIVLENFDNSVKLINTGIYMRNLSACVKNYGPCVYYNLCHKNKMDGLVVVEKK